MGFPGPRVIPTTIKGGVRGVGIFRKLNRLGGGWRFRPTLPRVWPTVNSSGYTPFRGLGCRLRGLNNCWRSIS